MNIESMVSIAAGPSQLIAALCDEIGLEKKINDSVTWHPSYWNVSPGTHIKAMVINILCARTPLYRIEEFYQQLDVELLFGPGRKASDFNDDALARTLDVLYEAEGWKVYSALALSSLNHLGLPLTTFHNDTTSFSVYGDYPDTEDLRVTHGYNKDGRPDLKQIIIGLGVTPERIPILGKVENGNKDDKTWNHEFIQKLRLILSAEDWDGLTYVADSALVTPDNIHELMDANLSFITRLPDTYDVGKELKETAIRQGSWEEIGQRGADPSSAYYRSQSFVRPLYGHDLRFVVVHSDHLAKRQQQSFLRLMEKEHLAIEGQLKRLRIERFACRHDAEAAITVFRKEQKWKWHLIDLITEEETYTLPRASRGRPKIGETAEQSIRWKVTAGNIKSNETARKLQEERQGMFVLMTSHQENEQWSSLKILETYKGQDAAETRFRLLKDPAILDAIYLKQPKRIEALVTVFVMALLLYGILEWRVRDNLEKEQIPIMLPGKRKSIKPTGEMLLILLKTIQVIVLRMEDGQLIRKISDLVDENVKRVLQLAGYDIKIYTQ